MVEYRDIDTWKHKPVQVDWASGFGKPGELTAKISLVQKTMIGGLRAKSRVPTTERL